MGVDVTDIVRAIREGRITEAGAARLLEQRLAEAREVRARSRRDRAGWTAGEEGEFSELWPPQTLEEADRRADADAEVRASRIEDMTDEELHRALFGDTEGPEAGGE